ncbi:MAG: DMT family transporter [Chloroflexi bacterium]|nr:DMT family transporter [Chloroflexota bacterium]
MRPISMPSRVSEHQTGMLAAAGAAFVYGAAYPATAVALRSFSPLGIAGWACTLALVLVVLLAAGGLIERPETAGLSRARLVRLTVLAVLGGAGFIAAINIAVALSGPTITGFVAPLYAVLATLFAVPILGEPVRAVTVAAFLVALGGTALLAGTAPLGAPVAGIAMAFAGAAMFGLYLVLARRWSGPYRLDGTPVTIANLLARGPGLLAVAALVETKPLIPATLDPAAILALISIVIGASSTGSLLVMASVRRVPAGRTSAALLLTPISSALIAAAVLGERLPPSGVLGAGLILVGIAGASGLLRTRPAPA